MSPQRNEGLKRVTKNLISSFADAVLVGIFYGFEFASHGKGGANYWSASYRAEKDLDKFNHDTIARALRYIRRKGLVQGIKEKISQDKITENGRKRLESILPSYDSVRAWDGILYLVTYDVPVSHNKERNNLRNFLKRIGCGMLQESLWVTPYNPKSLIREFVDESHLGGTILVSQLGRDGSVGEMELPELLEGVYKLSDLNRRYQEFIENHSDGKVSSKWGLIFDFLSILEDDPQLPFKLLPENWLGDQAYNLFKKLLKSTKT